MDVYASSGISTDGNLYVGGEIINSNYIELMINNMRLRSDVLLMQDKINEQEEQIAEMMKMVKALWYSPDMPGYLESKRSFEKQLN